MSGAAFRYPQVAWEAAPRCCPQQLFGCLAYHRIRPLLRRLGLAAEPDDQRAFLFPALVEALRGTRAHALVSGSVDEATAAMVAEAGAAAGGEPRITVLDRCPTPLLVNEAFAAATGAALATLQADILTYQARDPFDVIVTHSFFGQFAVAERPRLAAKWFELLRPGGRVITVARLRPGGEIRSFTGEAVERLAAEVRRRVTERAEEIGVPPDEAAEAAVEYAKQRPASFPLNSLEEITGLLRNAGFVLLHAEARESQGRITGIEGPGLPRGGLYAEVVAERP